MATATKSVHDVCVAAKAAERVLARTDRAAKDAVLRDLAERIEARSADLLEANSADLDTGREEGLNEALHRPPGADRGARRRDGEGRARDRGARRPGG